jgi:hypothetical protein
VLAVGGWRLEVWVGVAVAVAVGGWRLAVSGYNEFGLAVGVLVLCH